jgi:hypothetical protein
MKICYFIQTHKNPAQIYRLIHSIKKLSPNSQIIVSHDSTSCTLDVDALENLAGVRVFLVESVNRGDFTQVQNYLDSVDWLLTNKIDFDWLINLSGQDYPIKSLAQIEKFLADTKYDGFMSYRNILSQPTRWDTKMCLARYFYQYKIFTKNLSKWTETLLKPLKIINYFQPWFRVNFTYGIKIGVKAKTPFNRDFVCYKGSYFCTLSRKCIEYLHLVSKTNSNLVDYYKRVDVPDESFLQTLIINSGFFNICNECKHYIDFSKTNSGHPQSLTTDDYINLIQSDRHFARKFDPSLDSEILDLLDSKVLQLSRSAR